MNDKYLDKLIRKSSSGNNNTVTAKRKPASRSSVNPYSFRSYWKIRQQWDESGIAIFAWSFVYALCFLSLFFFFIMPASEIMISLRIVSTALCFLCIIKIFYYHIKTVFTYPFYIKWEKRMPFNVYGWADLLKYDGFSNHDKWLNKCIITLSIKASSEYYVNAMKASMELFCKDTNRTFDKYYSESLARWDFDNNVLDGSCNCIIIGKIYRYITGDLTKIHKITEMIESVSIITDNKILVAPEIETSNTADSA